MPLDLNYSPAQPAQQQPAPQPQNFTPVNPQSAAEVPNEDPEHFAVWQFLHEQTGDPDFAHEGADMHMQQLQQEKSDEELHRNALRKADQFNYDLLNTPTPTEEDNMRSRIKLAQSAYPEPAAHPTSSRLQKTMAGVQDLLGGLGQIYTGVHRYPAGAAPRPIEQPQAFARLRAQDAATQQSDEEAKQRRNLIVTQMGMAGADNSRDIANKVHAADSVLNADAKQRAAGQKTATGLAQLRKQDIANADKMREAQVDPDAISAFLSGTGRFNADEISGYTAGSTSGAATISAQNRARIALEGLAGARTEKTGVETETGRAKLLITPRADVEKEIRRSMEEERKGSFYTTGKWDQKRADADPAYADAHKWDMPGYFESELKARTDAKLKEIGVGQPTARLTRDQADHHLRVLAAKYNTNPTLEEVMGKIAERLTANPNDAEAWEDYDQGVKPLLGGD